MSNDPLIFEHSRPGRVNHAQSAHFDGDLDGIISSPLDAFFVGAASAAKKSQKGFAAEAAPTGLNSKAHSTHSLRLRAFALDCQKRLAPGINRHSL